ncbi:MAG: sodium:proton antiporter NhaD [Longimicrobiaceae bacterium]
MTAPAAALDLTRHWAGYAGLAVFVLAYVLVMGEEKFGIRKSKPVVVAAGVMWAVIGAAYVRAGDHTTAGDAVRHSIGEYGELLLFIVASMVFVNAMEDRQVFDGLRAWLVRRRFSLRAVFWVTGLIAFLLSSQLANMTTALVMGAVVLAVGRGHPKFIGLAFINIVVACNAGGVFSPFGDITSLMVWQAGRAEFWDFFRLFLPALVNWIVPAAILSLAVPRGQPGGEEERVELRRGAFGVVGLFALTIVISVIAYNTLKLPPVIGMTTGLGLLQLYGAYLRRTHPRTPALLPAPFAPASVAAERLAPASTAAVDSAEPWAAPEVDFSVPLPDDLTFGEDPLAATTDDLAVHGEPADGAPAPAAAAAAPRAEADSAFDVFAILQRSEWDTLLFFFGIMLCVAALAQIGYLAGLSAALYGEQGPTAANVGIGLISAVVDNIPVMYAVLTMHPPMGLSQWLLVTLTAGVGGSLLSIGSAAGVALMGQGRGVYTFGSHLRWTWAIALGYAASIAVHLLINGR